eukprot:2199880-Amphidinium_carterae.1
MEHRSRQPIGSRKPHPEANSTDTAWDIAKNRSNLCTTCQKTPRKQEQTSKRKTTHNTVTFVSMLCLRAEARACELRYAAKCADDVVWMAGRLPKCHSGQHRLPRCGAAHSRVVTPIFCCFTSSRRIDWSGAA